MGKQNINNGEKCRGLLFFKITVFFCVMFVMINIMCFPLKVWFDRCWQNFVDSNADHSVVSVLFEVLVPLIAEFFVIVITGGITFYKGILGNEPYAEVVEGKILEDISSYKGYMPSVICTSTESGGEQPTKFPIINRLFSYVIRIRLKAQEGCNIRFFKINNITLEFGIEKKETLIFEEAFLSKEQKEDGNDVHSYEVCDKKNQSIFPCINNGEFCCLPIQLQINKDIEEVVQLFRPMEERIFMKLDIYIYNNNGYRKHLNIPLEMKQQSDANRIYWTAYNEFEGEN